MKTKKCSKCNLTKPVNEFYNDRRQNRAPQTSNCKECCKRSVRRWLTSINGLLTALYSAQKNRCKKRKHNMPKYSLQEFKDWMNNHSEFNKLYINWVQSGFKRENRPSIDRINDYETYSFENIELTTWGNHFSTCCEKQLRQEGRNQTESCPVIQFSLKGEKIKEFNSIRQASKFTKIEASLIRRCLISRKTSTHDCLWMKTSEYNAGLRDFHLHRSQSISVIMLSKELEFIHEYSSISKAAKSIGISPSFLSAILLKVKKNSTEYEWVYSKNYNTSK